MDELLARARGGDPQGALAGANAKVEAVAKRSGTNGTQYATVLFEHGTVCLVLGMVARAIESMRKASEIRGERPEDEKARLTYLMNLGDVLAHAGKLDDAIAAHERGLQERERFYGKQHPGYAYGLDSWADVAIALGRYDEAIKVAKESLAIYDAHRHERIPHAWALLFLAGAGAGAVWQKLQMGPVTG